MPCYAGITTDPKKRKEKHKSTKKYSNLRNWKQYKFGSRKEAQAWENKQKCEHSPGGSNPDNPGATWYGYRFDY